MKNSLDYNNVNESTSDDSRMLILEEPQLSLLDDYLSTKYNNSDKKLNFDSLEYFRNQIINEFNKVKYVDECLDKKRHFETLLKYYDSKIIAHLIPKKISQNTFEFIDLFCGAGGLSAGLEQTGFIPSLALDKDKPSLQTYHFNRPLLDNLQTILCKI